MLARIINKSLKENTLTVEYNDDQLVINLLVSDNILILIEQNKYLISHSMYIDWYIDQKLNEKYRNIEEEDDDNETKALLELLEYRSFYHVKNWCMWHPNEFATILAKLGKETLGNSGFNRLLALIQSFLENEYIKQLVTITITWLIENWKNKTSQINSLNHQIKKLAEILIANVEIIDTTSFEKLIDSALIEYTSNPCAKLLIDMILTTEHCSDVVEHRPQVMLKILEAISLFQLPDYHPVSPFQGPYFDILIKLGENPEHLKRIIYLINAYIDELIVKNNLTPDTIQISFNKQKIQVKGTYNLWCLYRGYPQDEVPSALIACLMSLELWLMSFFVKEINNFSKRLMMNLIIPTIVENSTNICTLAIVAAFLSANKEEFGHLGYPFLEQKQFLEWDRQRKLMESTWAILSIGMYWQQDLILPQIDFHLKVKAQSDRFPYRQNELLDLAIHIINPANQSIKEPARKTVNDSIERHIIAAVDPKNATPISWLCLLYEVNNIRRKRLSLFPRKLEEDIQLYIEQKKYLELCLSKIR